MNIENIYPKCRTFLEEGLWLSLADAPELINNHEKFSKILTRENVNKQLPGFLSNLAQIEWALYQIRSGRDMIPGEISRLTVNPTLNILELEWKKLAEIFQSSHLSDINPAPGNELLMLWLNPANGKECIEPAASEDLLVLKMIIEDIPAETIAESAKVPIGTVD